MKDLASLAGGLLALILAGCGAPGGTVTNTSSTVGTDSSDAPRVDYSQLAVSGDHALVIDGTVPTTFLEADLSTAGEIALRPVEPPVAMRAYRIATVGDRIVVVGSRCDKPLEKTDIEIMCQPGTALAFAFDPTSGKWSTIHFGLRDARLNDAVFPGTDVERTGLWAVVADSKHPTGQPQLFTLDVSNLSIVPQDLPEGSTPTSQGASTPCFANTGAESIVTSASAESVGGAAGVRMWHRLSSATGWREVPLPSGGATAWRFSDCIDGAVVFSTFDPKTGKSGTERRRYDDTTSTWQTAQVEPWADTGSVPIWVNESPGRRMWVDGSLWSYDAQSGEYVKLNKPSTPVQGVIRGSAPWGDDKLVLLVDRDGQPSNSKVDLAVSVLSSSQR